MDSIQLISFEIISAVRTAKNMYVEAIQEAKKGNFGKAEDLITEGKNTFKEGHRVHASLVKKEASGEGVEVSFLLLHAENQLMNAETIELTASEIIELYRNK